MALNFPDSPTNGQKYTDATTGETWTYELATNSWTSDGLTTAVGIQYKGGINITTAPPAGVAGGWQYTVTTGGTANAGFTGLTGNVPAGTTIIYDGATWQTAGAGVLWVRTGTELTPSSAGDAVFTSGAVKVGGTTAAPNLQIKADGGIVANTDGLVYDAATKRLGIGTAVPGVPLEVNGAIRSKIAASADASICAINSFASFYFLQQSDKAQLYTGAAQPIVFTNNNTERARIDSSGRLLVGTSSARTNILGTGGLFQQEGANNDGARVISIVYGKADAGDPLLVLGKHRSNSIGGTTIVADGDGLGQVVFTGSDGTNFTQGAAIRAQVDGTPGLNDMPGRLVFSTTLDGASAPNEALRITNDRVIAYNQATPVAVNATATLTVANLKNGIIISTSAAATDMTLPTGTDTQAGFNGTYDNMTFEWSVINTGPSLVRVLAGTAHTIVGSGSVATGTSGRFASRRTAANTFVTYRLS